MNWANLWTTLLFSHCIHLYSSHWNTCLRKQRVRTCFLFDLRNGSLFCHLWPDPYSQNLNSFSRAYLFPIACPFIHSFCGLEPQGPGILIFYFSFSSALLSSRTEEFYLFINFLPSAQTCTSQINRGTKEETILYCLLLNLLYLCHFAFMIFHKYSRGSEFNGKVKIYWKIDVEE